MPTSSSSVGDPGTSPELAFALRPLPDGLYRLSLDSESPSEDGADDLAPSGASVPVTAFVDSDDDEFHDCRPPTLMLARGVTFVDPPADTGDGDAAGPTAEGEGLEAVYLNVYDLLGEADGVTGKLAAALGVGLFHCGVEVYGREWSFSGTIYPEDEGQSGIFWTAPKTALPNHSQSIFMGWCGPTQRDVRRLLGRMRDEWRRGHYHILTRNCNHFAEALVHLLAGEKAEVPAWVNRVARLGDLLVPDAVVEYFVGKAHERLREEFDDCEAHHFPTDHQEDCRSILSSWTDGGFHPERCLSSPLPSGPSSPPPRPPSPVGPRGTPGSLPLAGTHPSGPPVPSAVPSPTLCHTGPAHTPHE